MTTAPGQSRPAFPVPTPDAARAPLIARWAAWVRRQQGWRARGLVALAGLMAALALPPFHLVPLLIVALPVLVWRLDACPGWRGGLATGFWFGLGHFVGMIHWVSFAFLVDIARFGWMIPFAVAGLAGVLALFPAAALAVVRPLWRADSASRLVVLAAAWTLGEWLRCWGLTGFPWAPLGMVWTPFDGILQGAALVGVLGLSWMTVLLAALPALLADPTVARAPAAGGGWRRRGLALTILGLAAGLIGLEGLGQARLAAHPEPAEALAADPLLRVRLVQPSIPQADKWNPALIQDNFLRTLDLSARPGLESRDLVVWGETAVPYSLDLAPEVRAALTRAVPPGGHLVTGAPRRSPSWEPVALWNSLFAVDAMGTIVAVYDKAHLVPFGEYVPFGDILPLDKITAGSTDFTPGPGRRSLTIGALPPVSPLICYEVIFPGQVLPPPGAGPRPRWLLNLTNDAWYGHSAGPYQHFQISRLRAIEEGLPLVRVANTGISGVISPLGRVSETLGLDEVGILDLPVPHPLKTRTLFSRFGNAIPLAIIAACLCIGAIVFYRRQK